MNSSSKLSVIILICTLLVLTNFVSLFAAGNDDSGVHVGAPSRTSSRALTFTEASSGLPTTGDYNYIAFGDFNSDTNIDIAFGGEDYSNMVGQGIYAYAGNGGSSWNDASSGLPSENSWGGLQLADADSDSLMELYGTDEHWGTDNKEGLKVWEYQSGSWTDSATHVSTPLPAGNPDNVIITDITGDSSLDMVLCRNNGLKYYENSGGNPAIWQDKSTGLATDGEFTAAAVGDVNKDGLKDIVACDYSDHEYLFIQKSSGTLWSDQSTGVTSPGNTLGAAVGDVNGDSHMDIVFGTTGSGVKCLLGNSGGADGSTFTWTEANSGLPTGNRYLQIQLADIDGDTDLDLIAPAASGNKGIQIYLGNGAASPGTDMTWTLATSTNVASSDNWCGANVYDINGDGSLDIVGASWSNKGIKAWLNDGGTVEPDNTAPDAITDLEIKEMGEDYATLGWSAVGDDGSDGTATKYDVRYSESLITDSNWNTAQQADGEPSPKSAGKQETFVVTGLESATTYYFAIKVADEVLNWAPLSNVETGTTSGVSKPPLAVVLTPSKTTVDSGESFTLTIKATTQDGGSAVSGASVELSSDSTGVVITPVTGTTDGTGELSAAITAPMLSAAGEITIFSKVSEADYKSNYTWVVIDVNALKPDQQYNLKIVKEDITFSESDINDGDYVTIYAKIENDGSLDAEDFSVKFYVNDNQLGSGSEHDLQSGETVSAEAVWLASEGTHKIKVEIVPKETVLDSNSGDNSAETEITVGTKGDTDEDDDEKEGMLDNTLFLVIVIIAVVIVVVLIMVAKGKSKGGKQPEPEERVETEEDSK
ncbi:MAG: VCBS repeat-containing protein [Thermoplasmata archaeon]|nr:MAG: VCBS repeat-containing protein [Thermoplasmata archaeon]